MQLSGGCARRRPRRRVVGCPGEFSWSGRNGILSCVWCPRMADSISNAKLRQCVKKQCVRKRVKLRCKKKDKSEAGCQPFNPDGGYQRLRGGRSPIGTSSSPANDVQWCEMPIDTDCQAKLLVHELAHTCGWRDA